MKKFAYVSLALLIASTGFAQEGLLGPPVENHEAAGVEVLVGDTWLFPSAVDNGDYWEPFTDIFGVDGTIAIIAGAWPEGIDSQAMNAQVAFIDMEGNVIERWAWIQDDGQPYKDYNFNEVRTTGNPPRIAVDRRKNGTKRYIVGQEGTPYMYDEFSSDNRWEGDFIYTSQVAVVQINELNPDNTVSKVTNVFDPIYGVSGIAGNQGGQQIRFGGDLTSLSNGNFVTVPEDRARGVVDTGNGAVATIFTQDGTLVKAPFNASIEGNAHEIWSNVTSFNNGWVVRLGGKLNVWSNAGDPLYVLDQATFCSVEDRGRGDDKRIAGSLEHGFVYFSGRNPDNDVSLSRVDVTQSSADNPVGAKEILVNNLDYWDLNVFNRVECAVDEFNNSAVCFDETFSSENAQVVCAIFNSDMEPVTPIFFAFEQHDWLGGGEFGGYTNKEVNVSMDNQRIVIAADAVMADPAGGMTPREQTFCIVLKNPLAQEVPVREWTVY